MNKANLIDALTAETGLTKGKAKEVVALMFEKVSEALAGSDRVEI